MRKNKLEKTSKDNIYTFKTKGGETHYYLSFELNHTRYQNKNITKLFNVKSLREASAKLEKVKSNIRDGKNPFAKDFRQDTVKNFIVQLISKKKPSHEDKDNSAYKKSLEVFYYKYIDCVIGHLKFENVTETHIEKILASTEHLCRDRQLLLKVLLYKEFEKRFRKGSIKENPLYDKEYEGRKSKKVKLSDRLNESIEEVAIKLYKGILDSDYKTKLLLLINLMCARRIGEIASLLFKDIKQDNKGNYFVFAYPKITKTGIVEKYPLPREVINLLPSNIMDKKYADKKLFEFHKNTIYLNYNKLLKKANVNLNNEYKLTTHDSRNIFISLLTRKGFDSELADSCLSHSKFDSKGTYLDVEYEKNCETFEVYWSILRGTKSTSQKL